MLPVRLGERVEGYHPPPVGLQHCAAVGIPASYTPPGELLTLLVGFAPRLRIRKVVQQVLGSGLLALRQLIEHTDDPEYKTLPDGKAPSTCPESGISSCGTSPACVYIVYRMSTACLKPQSPRQSLILVNYQ